MKKQCSMRAFLESTFQSNFLRTHSVLGFQSSVIILLPFIKCHFATTQLVFYSEFLGQ